LENKVAVIFIGRAKLCALD